MLKNVVAVIDFSPARVSLYVYNMYMAVCISGWSSSGGSASE